MGAPIARNHLGASRVFSRRHLIAVALLASWPAVRTARDGLGLALTPEIAPGSLTEQPPSAQSASSQPGPPSVQHGPAQAEQTEPQDFPSMAQVAKFRRAGKKLFGPLRLPTLKWPWNQRAFCGAKSLGRRARKELHRGSAMAPAAPPSLSGRLSPFKAVAKKITKTVMRVFPVGLHEKLRHGLQTHPAATSGLFKQAGDLSKAATDFFMFIKDYGWTLRYHVSRIAGQLVMDEPMKVDWVKLKKPVKDPAALVSTSSEDLFDWSVTKPPNNKGFGYSVASVLDEGITMVINFMQGRGVSLLIRHDGGNFQLLGSPAGHPLSVTHCWVNVMGLPVVPIVKSISFFDIGEQVMNWRVV